MNTFSRSAEASSKQRRPFQYTVQPQRCYSPSTSTMSYCAGHFTLTTLLLLHGAAMLPQPVIISPLSAVQGLSDSVKVMQSSSEPKLDTLSPSAAAFSMLELMESLAEACFLHQEPCRRLQVSPQLRNLTSSTQERPRLSKPHLHLGAMAPLLLVTLWLNIGRATG